MSKLVFRLLNHKDLTGRLAYADELLQEYTRVVNEIEGICMGVVHNEEDDQEAMRKNLAWLDEKRAKYGIFTDYEVKESIEKIGFKYEEEEEEEAKQPRSKPVAKKTVQEKTVQEKTVPKKTEPVKATAKQVEDDEPVPKEFLTDDSEVTEADVRKALAEFADEFGDQKAVEIVQRFGVRKVRDLDASKYGALIGEIRKEMKPS